MTGHCSGEGALGSCEGRGDDDEDEDEDEELFSHQIIPIITVCRFPNENLSIERVKQE